MKNRRIFVSLFLFTLFFLNACGNNSQGKSGNTQVNATNSVKIGFLLKTFQEPRYQKDKQYFLEKAKEMGVEVIFDSANNNEAAQIAKFENMLVQGVKVIVLQPVNTGTAGNMVEMAHKKGVRVVGYDSMLVNGPLDVMVMQDSWAVGQLQAEEMIKWLKKKKGKVEGNVVLIKGQPGDNNAMAMSSGVLKTILENPNLKLVLEQSHENWSSEKALATTENALTKFNNDIDAFICNNSGMARGVISGLDSKGLADSSKIFVAGSDADLPNVQYVAEGKQTVEIWKKIRPLAEKAVEIAVLLANNPDTPVDKLVKPEKMLYNNFQEVPTFVTPVVAITKENIDDTIIKEGFYTHQEVYGK